ncbi:AMP-binding domain protein [Mycobacterium kansasii 732]|nr:AMP-binding domain protein [Mycobacterium kansasii 732]
MMRPGHHFPRRGAVDVVIGAPIRPAGPDWDAAVDVQRKAREAVLQMSGEPDVE